MKKLLAAIILSVLVLAPGTAHADDAVSRAVSVIPVDGADRAPANSAAKQLFASGCWHGRGCVIFSYPFGTYGGRFFTADACQTGGDWIAFYD